MEVLDRLLEGKTGSHILPFLWMKGEDNQVIKEELDRIQECQIREICLESRPHPDFCGPGWWKNLDFIMEEARKRGMRVWILDDNKFPTGHCNGGLESRYPEHSKIYLAERHMDIMGPCKNNAVLVENFLGNDGELLGILAFPKPNGNDLSVSCDGIINLTENYQEGFVYFNLPSGPYRLFVLFTTRRGGGRAHYMNLIDSSSVGVLIDEVYEKHYQRYSSYFGKEFAGFFSDEPELGNVPGYSFDCSLGQKDIRLPWSRELERALKKKWNQAFICNLPLLWYEGDERTKTIRYTYMDCMTELVKTCFSEQIGKWCEAHQVEYIGHILEDANSHTKLGCGTGHYFREMVGQHMSGIDVVHHQIIPGFTQKVHQWIAGDTDGEFFHFGLGKLGSSAAHIDPKKKNRALCEIFGNYGWAEGMSLMHWLTDHMLVRGINQFTPHAFSMQEYDRDCPPHFFANGANPQFACFVQLMKYMNRSATLLSEGVHSAQAAVLYHGDMEWASGTTGLFQRPVRELLENQLDCDVIPADILTGIHTEVKHGKMKINRETYPCLIVPGCSVLPDEAAAFMIGAAREGLKIFFTDELPVSSVSGRVLSDEFYRRVSLVPIEKLAAEVEKLSHMPVRVLEHEKSLRLFTMEQEDGSVSMLFNEDVDKEICITLMFQDSQGETAAIYDPWTNQVRRFRLKEQCLTLNLLPGNSVLICRDAENGICGEMPVLESVQRLEINWEVERRLWEGQVEFEEYKTLRSKDILPNLNGPGYEPGFTGTYRYKGQFAFRRDTHKQYVLQFQEASDTMYLKINDCELGYVGRFPARIEVTDVLVDGVNKIQADITTTLVWSRKDGASTHLQIPPSGLTRQPLMEVYNNLDLQ